MRSTLFLAATAPLLVTAAPPSSPRITSLTYSGNGCPGSNSVSTSTSALGDSATFHFSQFRSDNTNNCELHIVSQGGSQGWQVAVKEVTYQGHLTLKPRSSLDTFTQVFWSEKAGDTTTLTGGITCAGPEIRDSFTLKQTTNDLTWSKCTGADGYPGILNVNHRPVIQGDSGNYDVKSATWNLVWRKC